MRARRHQRVPANDDNTFDFFPIRTARSACRAKDHQITSHQPLLRACQVRVDHTGPVKARSDHHGMSSRRSASVTGIFPTPLREAQTSERRYAIEPVNRS
eukprot:scaffold91096_cov62-Phaeocystis_antarctica.AAC.2